MKAKKIILMLLATIFITSCELDRKEGNLETLVSYIEKLNIEGLSKVIEGKNFRAEIIYQDERGRYYPLTLAGCYEAFVDEGYNKEFSYKFCQYLIYKALNKVLKKRASQLEPQVKALIEDYRNYIKEKEKTLETIKKIALYSIPIFFAFAGLITGMGVYRLMNVKKKEEEIEREIAKQKEEIELYKQQKEEEARKIVARAKEEAEQILEKAKEEAIDIGRTAYEQGYKKGQEQHKRELKSLRSKISAVKSIFKARPELNWCFRKVTGWDFEKWLKER